MDSTPPPFTNSKQALLWCLIRHTSYCKPTKWTIDSASNRLQILALTIVRKLPSLWSLITSGARATNVIFRCCSIPCAIGWEIPRSLCDVGSMYIYTLTLPIVLTPVIIKCFLSIILRGVQKTLRMAVLLCNVYHLYDFTPYAYKGIKLSLILFSGQLQAWSCTRI